MREIKFRVWDKNNKTYEGIYQIDSNKNLYDFGYIEPLDKDNYIIEQFTVLKDKNGKEIYEGDILAFEYRFDNIVSRDIFTIKNKEEVKDDEFLGFMYGFYFEHIPSICNIIGNIHENPELLENN